MGQRLLKHVFVVFINFQLHIKLANVVGNWPRTLVLLHIIITDHTLMVGLLTVCDRYLVGSLLVVLGYRALMLHPMCVCVCAC